MLDISCSTDFARTYMVIQVRLNSNSLQPTSSWPWTLPLPSSKIKSFPCDKQVFILRSPKTKKEAGYQVLDVLIRGKMGRRVERYLRLWDGRWFLSTTTAFLCHLGQFSALESSQECCEDVIPYWARQDCLLEKWELSKDNLANSGESGNMSK